MPFLPPAAANAMLATLLTAGTTYYMSLHAGSPGTTGVNEVAGGTYGRQPLVFGAASGGSQASTDAQSFAGMPACTPTNFGIWTAVTGGTYIGGGTLSSSPALPNGSTVNFATGAVVASVN